MFTGNGELTNRFNSALAAYTVDRTDGQRLDFCRHATRPKSRADHLGCVPWGCQSPSIWAGKIDFAPLIKNKLVFVAEEKQAFTVTYEAGDGVLTRVSGYDRLQDRIALVLFSVVVANNLKEQTTLKEMLLLYVQNGKEQQPIESFVLKTSPQGGSPAIVLRPVEAHRNPMVLMGWYNMRHVILSNGLVGPGGVWRGSAAFIFPKSVREFSDVSSLRLKISDFTGHSISAKVGLTKFEGDYSLWLGTFKQEPTDQRLTFYPDE